MKHLTRRSLNTALLATTVISASAFIAPIAAHAQADAYPSKPITLVDRYYFELLIQDLRFTENRPLLRPR